MKTRKRVATLFILGALLLSTVTPVLGAPSLQDDALSVSFECEQTDPLDPLVVTCTAEVTGGTTPYTFVWDFGDGKPTVTTTVGEVTYTYTEADTYDVTLLVTDDEGASADDTVTLAVGEPSEHIISNLIAAFFIVPPEDIDGLREDGWGYGEIAIAYFLAQHSDVGLEAIIDQRQDDGLGWGQIAKGLDLTPANRDRNLGAIMSGRATPADDAGVEVESASTKGPKETPPGWEHGKGQGSQGQGHDKGDQGQGQAQGKGKGKGPKH